MKTQYYLVGKVALAVVTGELPRIGEMLVLAADGKVERFRVIDIQHGLRKMAFGGYEETRIEVFTELVS